MENQQGCMIGCLDKPIPFDIMGDNMSKQYTEHRQTVHHNVRMSDEAYNFVKEKSKDIKYRGRGLVGVLDDLLLGEFTTIGSGKRGGQRRPKKV